MTSENFLVDKITLVCMRNVDVTWLKTFALLLVTEPGINSLCGCNLEYSRYFGKYILNIPA